jgi:membrane protein YdbS with pleckstrin-like domain
LEEVFKPHHNMVFLYRIYLALCVAPLALCGIVVSWLVYIFEPAYVPIPIMTFFALTIATICFIFYWSSRYYKSITYHLTSDEVVVKRGVWWRVKSTVPYARVMSVEVVQGPISRRLGIATVDIYTAGYTGVAGGTAGPKSRRAEASLIHISNYSEVREKVLSLVRGRPLFGVGGSTADMLSELRRIRELLEKQSR